MVKMAVLYQGSIAWHAWLCIAQRIESDENHQEDLTMSHKTQSQTPCLPDTFPEDYGSSSLQDLVNSYL